MALKSSISLKYIFSLTVFPDLHELKQRLRMEWAKLGHVINAAAIRQWRRYNNKITFKRTWSLSNAVCFKYVKYLTTNTAKVGHVTPSRSPLT